MTLTFDAIDGIGEIAAGDDLAALVAERANLLDGDVVVITSKIVSKAAGLTTTMPKDALLEAQTDRVVARRGDIQIIRTLHGLTMAAAGIDASNTSPGTLIPLPQDPDVSARELRARLRHLTGARVGVIISDTAGRAWRNGQTDISIGCAGIAPFESFAGQLDPYGNMLAVTSPAVADQLAGGAELASGKFGKRPIVLVRGANPRWIIDDDGPGATALIREEADDLFGLGSRDAVVAALTQPSPVRGFPSGDSMDIDALVAQARPGRFPVKVDGARVTVSTTNDVADLLEAGALRQRLEALGVAYAATVTVKVEVNGSASDA